MKNNLWLDKSSVRRRLNDSLKTATASGQQLASYMLANISELPFETSRSVAKKVGVSELTVGRFCRSIGYTGFKELKEHLKDDISDSPWLLGDRLHSLQKKSTNGDNELALSLELEIAALVHVFECTRTEAWKRASSHLAKSHRVFIAGFQTERGLADSFAHLLRYLRDGIHILDIAGGNFSELLLTPPDDCTLLIIDTRRYSHQSKLLAMKTKELNIPTILVTDLFCDWGLSYASEVFAVPTEMNRCWDSSSAIWTLLQLMLNTVFTLLSPNVTERLNNISILYEEFVGHTNRKKT